MPWTYDELNPTATARDRIRTRIRDVVQDDWSPSDELIAAWLVQYGTELRTALEAARFRRDRHAELNPQSRTAVGMTSTRPSPSPLDLIVSDLEKLVRSASGGIETFGIKQSDIRDVESDPDFVPPFAGVGRNRNL